MQMNSDLQIIDFQWKIVSEFGLCVLVLGLYEIASICYESRLKMCTYDVRIINVFQHAHLHILALSPFLIQCSLHNSCIPRHCTKLPKISSIWNYNFRQFGVWCSLVSYVYTYTIVDSFKWHLLCSLVVGMPFRLL